MKKLLCLVVMLSLMLIMPFEVFALNNDESDFPTVLLAAAKTKKKSAKKHVKPPKSMKTKLTKKDYDEFVRICKSKNLQQFKAKLEKENISPDAMYYSDGGWTETLLTIAITPEAIYNLDNREIINFLISKGADVNKTITWNYGMEPTGQTTPLMVAAYGTSPQVVKRLIEVGAMVNAKDEDGEMALHFTFEGMQGAELDNSNRNRDNRVQVVKILLQAGADANARYGHNNKKTPIMLAAQSMNDKGVLISALPDVVNMLLRAGADINTKDSDGNTALMQASSVYPGANVIEILLKAGADAKLKNKEGKRAIDLLREAHPILSRKFTGTRGLKMLEAASK